MTWAVYAVTNAGAGRLGIRGLRNEPVTLVSAGRLAAAVGEVPRCPKATSRALVAYHDVIQRLWLDLPAILPARYGTCVDDLGELTFILRARAARLGRTLRGVRHRAQMTVRVQGAGNGDRGSGTSDRGSGVGYLRSRAADAARARSVPEIDALRPVVRRWVRDERVEKRGTVAIVYHLIPRASADAYRRALSTAAAAARVPLVVTGPFAPYAFADDLLH